MQPKEDVTGGNQSKPSDKRKSI